MAGALLLFAVGALAVSVQLLRTPRLRAAPGRGAISVVVPARDEAANLPALLRSLAAGDVVPGEVIVVDDGSTDATAVVALAHGAQVVDPGAPPAGWLGKPWACARGAVVAKCERIAFVDADVRFAPGGLGAVLAAHERAGGLVSVQPSHRPERLVEELSAVFNVCAVAGTGGASPGRARLAFGPCLVVDRADYDRIGGHGAVAGSVIEDVDLGRSARRRGVAVSAFRGGELVTFRMYPGGWWALLDGWTKNIARGAGAAPWWAVLATVAWVAGLGAVATQSAIALAAGDVAALAYVVAAAHTAWVLRRVGRFRTVTALAYPVPLVLFIVVFAGSLLAVATRRPVRWRNRLVVHEEPRR